jgi:hypothetical protein
MTSHLCRIVRWTLLGSMVLAAISAPALASGGGILWDTSHGVYQNYVPDGAYTDPLVNDLTAIGFTVTTTSQGVLTDDPGAYKVLVLGLGSSWTSAYTPDEVARITSFVSSGGGLLLMGDSPNCPNANLQPVATAFGITLGVSVWGDVASNLAPSPIFDGIAAIQLQRAGEIASTGILPIVATGDISGKPIVAAGSYGAGHVVVFGDIDYWDTYNFPDETSRLFATNTFNYLASPEPATLTLLAVGCGAALLRRRKAV